MSYVNISRFSHSRGEELDFVAANVAVSVIRLFVIGVVWWIAILLVDRLAFRSTDPFVGNLRLGLWLFLTELLVGTYYVRYTAPPQLPYSKRIAFILSESLTQTRNVALYMAVNLVVRWILLTMMTAITLAIIGDGWLCRLTPLLPSGSFAILWASGIAAVGFPVTIRGTHLGGRPEAARRALELTHAAQNSVVERLMEQGMRDVHRDDIQVFSLPWGGVVIPFLGFDPHFLILGTAGSGKTLILRTLLGAALGKGNLDHHRAIIYDGKREFLPILAGMGIPTDRILCLNPADARCVSWNIAGDIGGRDDAVNITNTLIPEQHRGNDNPFFTRAARALVAEVFVCLHTLSPGRWRLLDAINAMRSIETLKKILFMTVEGKECYERFFTAAVETSGGIISTLGLFIQEYDTISRIWARCDRSVTLSSWVNEHTILLLGFDANQAAVDRINQAVFQRLAQLISSQPERSGTASDQTWVMLDEMRFTGKLPMLPQLTSFGRSKGVRVVLASQDIDGLNEVYGEHQTNEMLALCGNVAVLRILSPKTRQWASNFFGEFEAWETDYSESTSVSRSSGKGGSSSSNTSGSSTRKVKREAILPAEFFDLPPTNRENGLHGFFSTPIIRAWRGPIPTAFLDAHLQPRDPEVSPFIPRSKSADDPMRWTRAEEERFTRRRDANNRAKPSSINPEEEREEKPPTPNDSSTDDSSTDDQDDELPDW